MARTARLLPVLVSLLAGACGGGEAPTTPAVPRASAWESVLRTTDSASVVIEKVAYRSGGLRVFGQICRPASAGPHPVMVVNHGGFEGLGAEWNGGMCRNVAEQQGYVAVESSYRGEDGSEGRIEICLGEVDDVLAMLDVVLQQPYADRRRVVMWGGSHGGCITTRAFQRGAPVHAAVDVFGPADLAATFAFWQAQIAAGSPFVKVYQDLVDLTTRAAGGTPAQVPAAYAARSPVRFADDLARRPEPFLIVHGVTDPLVPAIESCQLAARAGAFTSWHLAAAPEVALPTPPPACAAEALSWSTAPRPPGWPGARYLLIYDTAGHSFDGPGGQAMVSDLVTFLVARTPRLP
jgi:dienelactone hydrolase